MPARPPRGGPVPSVLLVGAGGIGSRHLQALARLDRPLDVVVVDPAEPSLATAQERVAQVRPGAAEAFRFTRSLEDAPAHVDVAVVATGAAVRAQVVTDLLERGSVRHLVLEKFLFQRRCDYAEVRALLAAAGTQAWVNTPRRLWPGYAQLAERFGGGPVECLVQAPGTLGIGTSAIHFADLLAYLAGESELALAGDDLEVVRSRHQGVAELTGTLRGRTAGGSHLQYSANRRTTAPLLVTLTWSHARAVVRESEQRCWTSTEQDGWSWEEQAFPTLFQSQLTDRVVADLLDRDTCGLPGYDESSSLHLAVLDGVAEALGIAPDDATTPVPIT